MLLLAAAIVVGSRRLQHFDAALVGYTFATLFAAFGITYRYAMWLDRPPTRMYWRRGWEAFADVGSVFTTIGALTKRASTDVAANRFIFRRGWLRGLTHCRSCGAASWRRRSRSRWSGAGCTSRRSPVASISIARSSSACRFRIFRRFVPGLRDLHGLVWSSFLVLGGVLLAFRRRMIDHGAMAAQQFGQDILPLLLLFAISVTGLMLTASYTWMKGYGYEFLAILHAVTVIVTLLWLPFGKLFHIFQRPAQLGVSLYKDAGARGEQARCRRCGQPVRRR